MGCDIHAHIEYFVEPQSPQFPSRWDHFASPWVQRNYNLFGVIAGVRSGLLAPLYIPRGFPKDASMGTREAYSDRIVDWRCDCGESRTINKANVGPRAEYLLDESGGKTGRVIGADWHTPSWLDKDEFTIALSRLMEIESPDTIYREGETILSQELLAIRSALTAFKKSRLVFWFDN